MARTIAQIKDSITVDFMANETIASAYGFTAGESFSSRFSSVSLESLLFYVVATAIWALESLFDIHTAEITDILNSKKPHRLKWYRDKALSFMYGFSLQEDSDVYDTSGLTESAIELANVVKFAAAVEYQGRLYIKVAGDGPDVLNSDQETAINSYFSEIKDAGVVLEVVNKAADHFALDMTIYYDPMVYSNTGLRLDTGADTIRDTIKSFIKSLPFNGEYRNVSLTDNLQALEGVVIPELTLARTVSAEDFDAAVAAEEEIPWETVNAKHLPVSGYYTVYNDEDLNLSFVAYQTIETV